MEFKNFSFIIVGVLGTAFWALSFWKFFKLPQIYLPDKYVLKKIPVLKGIVFLIGLLGWMLISYSLMGPRLPLSNSSRTIEVNDIFLVVDLSRSMLANDFNPYRIEVAKEKILEFIEFRPKDRIGIIIFSERVFTLVPLTTDLDLLKKMVAQIKIGILGSGTNIGDALALAVGRLNTSEAKNKFIILLTDGVNNVGLLPPLKAGEIARDSGIKVYTIGIGGNDDAKIPMESNVYGGRMQNIPGGSVDLKTLEEISRMTHAKSFWAKDEGALKNILNEIEKMERSEIKVTGQTIYEEKYLFYLIIGVIMLLLSELQLKFLLREF